MRTDDKMGQTGKQGTEINTMNNKDSGSILWFITNNNKTACLQLSYRRNYVIKMGGKEKEKNPIRLQKKNILKRCKTNPHWKRLLSIGPTETLQPNRFL